MVVLMHLMDEVCAFLFLLFVILLAFVYYCTGYNRSSRQQPDTIILRGVPSRWFAEPRVSSKPSMLVTHSIFSAFGQIRCV